MGTYNVLDEYILFNSTAINGVVIYHSADGETEAEFCGRSNDHIFSGNVGIQSHFAWLCNRK